MLSTATGSNRSVDLRNNPEKNREESASATILWPHARNARHPAAGARARRRVRRRRHAGRTLVPEFDVFYPAHGKETADPLYTLGVALVLN